MNVLIDNKWYFIIPIQIEMISLDIKHAKYSNHLIFKINKSLFDLLDDIDFIFFNTKTKQYFLFNNYNIESDPIGYSDITLDYVIVTDFVSNHYEDFTSRVLAYFRKEKIKNILD